VNFDVPSHLSDFATDGDEPPRAGYRARLWRRFEDGYRMWLDTPEGRFATFVAQRDEAPAGVLAERN
jgi:hypothetical protein